MIQEQFTTVILKCDEEHRLTQVEEVDIKDRITASVVALGKNDSVDNWKEITIEEANEYERLKEEAMKAE